METFIHKPSGELVEKDPSPYAIGKRVLLWNLHAGTIIEKVIRGNNHHLVKVVMDNKKSSYYRRDGLYCHTDNLTPLK